MTLEDSIREFCYTFNNLLAYCEGLDIEQIYFDTFDFNKAAEELEIVAQYVRRFNADDQLCYSLGVLEILLNDISGY